MFAFIKWPYKNQQEKNFSIKPKSLSQLPKKEGTMSLRNKNGPKLELKLNLSPPPSQANLMSLVRSPSRSNTTSPSSCVSSETYQEEMETTISMLLVGCPRCLMYVMLSQDDPKCPKCKSTVLLDFLHQDVSAATTAPADITKRNKTWWNFFV